jgi:hypothetical protein
VDPASPGSTPTAAPPVGATPILPAARPTTWTVAPPPVLPVAPIAAPQVAAYPNPPTVMAQPTLPSVDRWARQTNRKLLELDLAAARLEVEAAGVEVTEAEEIRKKNPASISQSELRKRQLQVERAKIQVKRMEVQLEEAGKAETPRSRTLQPAGR